MNKTPLAAAIEALPAHARLSPSGSKKWLACPGSLTLEEPIPNNPTVYSDAGTACHWVGEQCLTLHRHAASFVDDDILVSREDEPLRFVTFTETMADWVQQYVDDFRQLAGSNPRWIEMRVDFTEWVSDTHETDVERQFGTADGVVLRPDDREEMHVDQVQYLELQIHDAKFGRTPVHVENNTQLMTYALGVIATLANKPDPYEGCHHILGTKDVEVNLKDDEDVLY